MLAILIHYLKWTIVFMMAEALPAPAIPIRQANDDFDQPEITNCEIFCKRVWECVQALFLLISGVTLFVINPTIFLTGFLIGVIFADQANEAIMRIMQVWENQRCLGTLAIGIAAFLALPATLAAATVLLSVQAGSQTFLAIRQQIEEQNQ